MKALTLYNPWAALIARGHKTWETRGGWGRQAVNYLDQRIAIHAGRECSTPMDLNNLPAARAIADALGTWDWPSLPRGAVVATARIVEVFNIVHLPEMDGDRLVLEGVRYRRMGRAGDAVQGITELVLEPGQEHFGHYAPGRWLFRLEEVRALGTPIEARGYQRFWDWTPPNLAAVA